MTDDLGSYAARPMPRKQRWEIERGLTRRERSLERAADNLIREYDRKKAKARSKKKRAKERRKERKREERERAKHTVRLPDRWFGTTLNTRVIRARRHELRTGRHGAAK